MGRGEYIDGIHYLKQIIINLYVFIISLFNKRNQNFIHGSPYFRSIKVGPFFLDTRREEKRKKNTFYLLICKYIQLNNNSVFLPYLFSSDAGEGW